MMNWEYPRVDPYSQWKLNMQNPYKRQILKPGENTQVDVQKDINGGCLFTIRMLEGREMRVTHFKLDREQSIGLGLAMLRQAGVPMDEVFNRQQAANKWLKDAEGGPLQ